MRSVLAVLGACAFAACSFPSYTLPDPLASICTDKLPSAAETGIDCGGGCPACGVGEKCKVATDCASLSCSAGFCVAPTCDDNAKNATETDVDCGGPCSPCRPGRDCLANLDCEQGVCAEAFCQFPNCTDTVLNGNETGLDCGGGCDPCDTGMGCAKDGDCKSQHCADGVCVAQACTDGLPNNHETDLDCGGPDCGPCQAEQHCAAQTDCTSLICDHQACTAYSCSDKVLNGSESDIDCGGGNCDGCQELQHCARAGDCSSGVCLSGYCVPSAPTNTALSRAGWSAQALKSYPDDNPDQVLDSVGGRWTSGTPQVSGLWFQVDMGKLQTFFSVVFTCDEAPLDAAAKYDVYLSTDGKYGAAAASGLYGGAISTAKFDTARLARYIKIQLTQEKTKWWSINEINVLK